MIAERIDHDDLAVNNDNSDPSKIVFDGLAGLPLRCW